MKRQQALGVVAVTSGSGAAQGWREGTVELRAGLILAAAGVAGAPLGVFIGGYVSKMLTVVLFAALMSVVALRMGFSALRSAGGSADAEQASRRSGRGTLCRYGGDGRLRLTAPCSAALAGGGLLVGVLSGFLGVGGGFLIVPALVLFTDIKVHRAVATSLLVITLTGLSGFASAIVAGRDIDWALAGLFMLGGIIGMFGGRRLARVLPERALLLVFALAMLVVAVFMLLKQLLLPS